MRVDGVIWVALLAALFVLVVLEIADVTNFV